MTDEAPADDTLVYRSSDGVTVIIRFVDLFDVDNSLRKIVEAVG